MAESKEEVKRQLRELMDLPPELGWEVMKASVVESAKELSLHADCDNDLFHTYMLGAALRVLFDDGLLDVTREQIVARFVENLCNFMDEMEAAIAKGIDPSTTTH